MRFRSQKIFVWPLLVCIGGFFTAHASAQTADNSAAADEAPANAPIVTESPAALQTTGAGPADATRPAAGRAGFEADRIVFRAYMDSTHISAPD